MKAEKPGYNFKGGNICFFCGKPAEQSKGSYTHGLCSEHSRIRREDIQNLHKPNRLLNEMNNPDSFFNQVYLRQSRDYKL